MNRRRAIALLGSAAVFAPFVAHAQQVTTIGFISSRSAAEAKGMANAFRQGLGEAGYVEGRNVRIEHRWADGHYDRLPGLAAELVRRQVALIATGGGAIAAQAAKAATPTIPIVFNGGTDPVAAGLVASLNKPGGNVTGVVNLGTGLTAKRFAMLHELVPAQPIIGVLRNPGSPEAELQLKEIRSAAQLFKLDIRLADVRTASELEPAFAALASERAGALLFANDPFFANNRHRLAKLAAHHRMPAIYPQREFVLAGGLMSYGTNLADGYRLSGIYAGRILRGEKPADLPVMQPTRFEFLINLQTAKTLGLAIRPTLLALADEVIE
jgi:putative ABC transport system substrate-binding protein